MTSGGSPLLSVRAESRQLVAPDYAVVDGLIEHTARCKAEAVQSVTASLDRLTAGLAALGAVPFDAGAARHPLTWSAYSSGTHEELRHDKETGQMERTGLVTATVLRGLPSGIWAGWMTWPACWRLSRTWTCRA